MPSAKKPRYRTRLKFLMLEKEEREGTRITYEDIAKQTGLSVATIDRYANSRDLKRPDYVVLKSLADFFGVLVDQFVYAEEDSSGQVVAVAAG